MTKNGNIGSGAGFLTIPQKMEKNRSNISTNSTTVDINTPGAGREDDEIINVEELLTEFHWKAGKDAAALESGLLNELSLLETANIGAVLETDGQVEAIIDRIDRAIYELDGVDSWLTLYKTELDSLGDDIFQIQSLNEALQIQSRNQQNLLEEVEKVLGQVSVPDSLADVLRKTKFETEGGMKTILDAAASIQRTIKTNYEEGVKDMSVINEQMEANILQANNFSSRAFEYLKVMFNYQVNTALTGQGKGTKLRIDMKNIKEELSKFRGLTLWLSEMDPSRHNELQHAYSAAVGNIYSSEYKGLSETFRSLTFLKKANTDDVKYLFTNPSSNKLGPTLHRRTGSDIVTDPKQPPDVVLNQILNVIFPDIIKEQNFFTLMFHIGVKSLDFQQWVREWEKYQAPIKDSDLLGLRKAQNDVKIRKRISENMETMFSNLSSELSALGETLIKFDWTLLVVLLVKAETFIERCENSNQEFLLKNLNNVHSLFRMHLDKNVDEQVKAIKELQVSGKKRSGILSFFKTFPEFLNRMEAFIGSAETPIRQQMDKCYQKIVNVMFDNLEVSAKQSEHLEKEQLNLHIIILENMHYFYMETGRYKKNSTIGGFNEQARSSYNTHLQAYVKDVIKRPLGKLLEFFEGIEALLRSRSPEEVGFNNSYNKTALKKVISMFPADEIRKSILVLYTRVKKHFSEEEGLLQVIWREIQEEFINQHKKMSELIKSCYPGSNITLEFTINDLFAIFSRVAKQQN
ncbi:hypothetical protein K502DRAFT_324647 [Neoconidiobolus thromboides FSU 785]|nr:hypothetical protein K502DRAFT_324647 [Neoconidiobolus thromboides FSU 785]